MFPVFRVPYLGAGMVIGSNATFHVYLAQGVAVGLVFLIATGDLYALRQGPAAAPGWDRLLRRMLLFSAISITIVSSVLGPGIWFTIGAIVPHTTGSMLRIFFWPWITEAVAFLFEVFVIIAFYVFWEQLGRRRMWRVVVVYLYNVFGLVSLVLITGILGYMLTVGEWPTSPNLWNAFVNPTFFPQTAARLALSFVTGAAIAIGLTLLSWRDRRLLAQALPLYGTILVVSLGLYVLSAWYYVLSVPNFYTTRSVWAMLTQYLAQSAWFFALANALAGAFLLALGIAAMLRSRVAAVAVVIPALVATLGAEIELERIREFIRGPYLMPSYMYANTLLMREHLLFNKEGLLPNSFWYARTRRTGDHMEAGAFLFNANCGTCHTISGINAIKTRMNGRSEDGIYVLLGHTHEMVSFMPPFSGTDDERRVTARFLYQLSRDRVRMRSHSRVVAGPEEWE